jgi:hypothetical protein
VQIQIEEELIIAKRRLDGSYNFTVATRLGEILDIVESRFGPRDKSFTVLGAEFYDGPPLFGSRATGDTLRFGSEE